MGIFRVFLMVLAVSIAAIFFCFRLMPSDVVNEHYETFAAAEKAGLFTRGWLPQIIPVSSEKIVITNDLDLNTSSGEFHFSPPELDSFLQKMTPISNASQLFTKERQRRLVKDGYKPYEFIQHDIRWEFLVDDKQSHALYEMRGRR